MHPNKKPTIAISGVSFAALSAGWMLHQNGYPICFYEDSRDTEILNWGGVITYPPVGYLDNALPSCWEDFYRLLQLQPALPEDRFLEQSGWIAQAHAWIEPVYPLRAPRFILLGSPALPTYPTKPAAMQIEKVLQKEAICMELPTETHSFPCTLTQLSMQIRDASYRKKIQLAIDQNLSVLGRKISDYQIIFPPVLSSFDFKKNAPENSNQILAQEWGIPKTQIGQSIGLAPSPLGECFLQRVRKILEQIGELQPMDRLPEKTDRVVHLLSSHYAWMHYLNREKLAVPTHKPSNLSWLPSSTNNPIFLCGSARSYSTSFSLGTAIASGWVAAKEILKKY